MISLDDINAWLLTLKTELRKTENTRDDILKAADDPTAQVPREEYLAYAAGLEDDAADCDSRSPILKNSASFCAVTKLL